MTVFPKITVTWFSGFRHPVHGLEKCPRIPFNGSKWRIHALLNPFMRIIMNLYLRMFTDILPGAPTTQYMSDCTILQQVTQLQVCFGNRSQGHLRCSTVDSTLSFTEGHHQFWPQTLEGPLKKHCQREDRSHGLLRDTIRNKSEKRSASCVHRTMSTRDSLLWVPFIDSCCTQWYWWWWWRPRVDWETREGIECNVVGNQQN